MSGHSATTEEIEKLDIRVGRVPTNLRHSIKARMPVVMLLVLLK